MAREADQMPKEKSVGKLAGCLLVSAVVGAVVLFCFLQFTSTHLLCFEPNVQKISLNNRPLEVSSESCYVYSGFGRSDVVSYTFHGQNHRFRLEPDLRDDNSTVVTFGETARVDGRFNVIKLD